MKIKTKTLWLSWLYLFALCCVLGFIPSPNGFVQVLLGFVGVCFFIPGALLLIKGDQKSVFWVRLISILSLVLTTVSIIANMASSMIEGALGVTWGNVLQIILMILSTPMFCCQIWILSLLGWASLMSASILLKK